MTSLYYTFNHFFWMQFFVNYILNIVIKVKWHMLDQIWLNFKIVWNFWWVFENF